MVGAVLVSATAAEAPGALLKIAGLTVVERALKQLRRAGASPLVVATDGTIPLPRLDGVEVRPIASADELEALRAELAATVVPADVVRQGAGLDGGQRIVDEASRRAAEDDLFAALLRGDLGPVARHLNKPVSFRVTRHLLCKLPFTPNQITVVAGLIGLAGAASIALGGFALTALGHGLSHAQSVIDGCDGELARVRFQQSKLGEWLDTIVDDLLNASLICATGVGLWRDRGETLWLALGLAATACMLLYSTVAYATLIRQKAGGDFLKIRWWFAGGKDSKSLAAGDRTSAFGFLYALGRRDTFVFGWLLLALAGLPVGVLIWGGLLAAVNGVVAIGQLIVGDRGRQVAA